MQKLKYETRGMKIIILTISLLLLAGGWTYTNGHTDATLKIESNRKKIRLRQKNTFNRAANLLPLNAYLCDEVIEIEFSQPLQNVNVFINSDALPLVYEQQLNNVSENEKLSIPIKSLTSGIYQIEFNINNATTISGEFTIEETLLFN